MRIIRAGRDVQVELLREHLPAMLPDGVPGGPGGPAEGLHVLSQRLFQVRRVRHQADAEDVLQQPAPAGGQGGVLFESRAENRPRPLGRHVGGHQERAERAQVDDVRQRPDPGQRQGHVRRRGAQHQTAPDQQRRHAEPLAVAAARRTPRRRVRASRAVHAGHRLPVRQVRRVRAAHCARATGHRAAQVVRQQERRPRETHTLLSRKSNLLSPSRRLILRFFF